MTEIHRQSALRWVVGASLLGLLLFFLPSKEEEPVGVASPGDREHSRVAGAPERTPSASLEEPELTPLIVGVAAGVGKVHSTTSLKLLRPPIPTRYLSTDGPFGAITASLEALSGCPGACEAAEDLRDDLEASLEALDGWEGAAEDVCVARLAATWEVASIDAFLTMVEDPSRVFHLDFTEVEGVFDACDELAEGLPGYDQVTLRYLIHTLNSPEEVHAAEAVSMRLLSSSHEDVVEAGLRVSAPLLRDARVSSGWWDLAEQAADRAHGDVGETYRRASVNRAVARGDVRRAWAQWGHDTEADEGTASKVLSLAAAVCDPAEAGCFDGPTTPGELMESCSCAAQVLLDLDWDEARWRSVFGGRVGVELRHG